MVDTPPQKNDEQYPLLKVENGCGDSGRPPAQPGGAPGWNVTCSPKRSWYERWPELISACWMTGMLLSIFVLIIYGLGTLGVIRKQPIFVLKCNSSRPNNEVYYHHIVQPRGHVSFSRYFEYLSKMALQYSSLQFSVFFLIDDPYGFGLINNKIPLHLTIDGKVCDGLDRRELRDFHLKYPNVNFTIMPLTEFMAMTPLRYKWRKIPLSYIAFYARVFSVWKNGGIGMDLDFFSNQHNRHQMSDRRITAVMKQYNKGIKPEEYANTLNNIDRDEQNEFARTFYGIVNQILKETRSFLNRSLTFNQESSSKPFIRTHRNKREVVEKIQNTSPIVNATVAIPKTKLTNTTDITIINAPYENTETSLNVKNKSVDLNEKNEKVPFIGDIHLKSLVEDSKRGNKSRSVLHMPVRNDSEGPQVLLLYDFSIFSDNMGMPYAFPEQQHADSPVLPHTEDDFIDAIKTKKAAFFLSLSLEGTFIAAVSKQHPFLNHVISAGCQRMPPKFAIQDAIMTQCSLILNDDVYCSNIYLFYLGH